MRKDLDIKKLRKAIRRKYHDLIFYRKKVRRVGPCHLTPEEFLLLEYRARQSERRITQYLKQCAFAYLYEERIFPKRVEERITSLHTLCRNIATSMNQIAKNTNTVKRVTVFDLMEAKVSLKKLLREFDDFIRQKPNHDNKVAFPEDSQL